MFKRSSRAQYVNPQATLAHSRAATVVAPSTLFDASAAELDSLQFRGIVWGNLTPHDRRIALLGSLQTIEVKPGYVITGMRIRHGPRTIERIEALFIRPVTPVDLSGPEEEVTLNGFGGTGGQYVKEERATTGYALSGIRVYWGTYLAGVNLLWRQVSDPTRYQVGPLIGHAHTWVCADQVPGYQCDQQGKSLAQNGAGSPILAGAPLSNYLAMDTRAAPPNLGVASAHYPNMVVDVSDPTLFVTGLKIQSVAYGTGVISNVQCGYTDMAAVRKVSSDPRLSRLCCLGKGHPLMCGPNLFGTTAACDTLMASACGQLSTEVASVTPQCACYTSRIKAPVCYDKKCLDNAAYRPYVMTRTFSPCPDLLECNQYLGLPEDVKNSVVDNVKLQQTCSKNDSNGGAAPIGDNTNSDGQTGGDTSEVEFGTSNPDNWKIAAAVGTSVVGLVLLGGAALA